MKKPPPEHLASLESEVRLCLQLLGQYLNARRNDLGLSQEQAAARAGLSRTAVHNIEHGLSDEKISTLFRVCRTLRLGFGEVVAHLVHLVDHPEDRPARQGLKSQRGKNTRRSLQGR